MIRRCTNPADDHWKYYGGRGIKVCDRWLASFEDFWADVGDAPPGMTLDRIDNDGDYEPGNVRWATWLEQRANLRDYQRNKVECDNGHPYDEVNTYWRADGARNCRACSRENQRRYRRLRTQPRLGFDLDGEAS
jgi:hypothetical protein